ncbi:MAG: response regulator [Candidatus Omnitrophica bacterium]|nr:response regulator [Candidatus Omnitrophota bacterium]
MTDKKPRILLVDDEPNIIKVVGRRLEAEGFEVIPAMDGESAFEKARSGKPDLVILDLMLPGLNGYEVCRLLKAGAGTWNIPVIMLTARVQESDEARGFECGTDAYIGKPFRARELLDKIRQLLPKGSTQA